MSSLCFTIASTLRKHPEGLSLEGLTEAIQRTCPRTEVVHELCSPDGMLKELLDFGIYAIHERDGNYFFEYKPEEEARGTINGFIKTYLDAEARERK